jgi:hypothetical protein
MNVLDYTTVVIPVTTADKHTDVFDPNHKPLSEKDEKNWKACMLNAQSMMSLL